MTWTSILFLGALAGAAPPTEKAGGFVRGHIFVAAIEGEGCFNGDGQWIIEIDPVSGAWSVFADSADGLCDPSGLRFTPDGTRLLAANGGHITPSFDGGWIQAFNPDGTSEIILDASDGLYGPNGSNCLAFDEGGDLYVVNGENSRILRFPSSGGSPTVFADSQDDIYDRGALEFSPSGDLFYTGDLAGEVIRINPLGQATVFDGTRGFIALAFDDRENLFTAQAARVYRYDGPSPDLATRRVLADDFSNCCNETAIALSPDRRSLYFAENPGRVHAIDPDTGDSSLVADFTELSFLPRGMAVHVPVLAGDVERDGDLDLKDFAAWQRCWTGNEVIVTDPRCARADINGDGYVNSVDFAKFVPALTGPLGCNDAEPWEVLA